MPVHLAHSVAGSTVSCQPAAQSNRPRPVSRPPLVASRATAGPASKKDGMTWYQNIVSTTLMEEDEPEKDDRMAAVPAGRTSKSYATAALGINAAVPLNISPQPQIISSAEVGPRSFQSSRSRYPTAKSRLSSKINNGLGPRDVYNPSNTRGPHSNAQIPRSTIVRSTIRAPTTIVSACQAMTLGHHYENLTIKDFQIGMIFTASHYVEMMDKKVPKDDPSYVESHVGVCSAKERHMILIGKLGGNLLTLTVTSKGSRGLLCVPEPYRHQYMEIRHHNSPPSCEIGDYAPVVVQNWAMDYMLEPESLIRLVEPYIVQCGQSIRIEGMISKRSYDSIKTQFTRLLLNSFERFQYGM